MAEENAKPVNRTKEPLEIHHLTDEEIEIFREDFREKDREIQRNIGIYLSGLVLITGWLIGPQTKPLIKMALDNYGYNLFGFLIVVALNVIFTCFLIYKSLNIHEIMQFVVVHSERESSLNYWEAWRRSAQSATNRGLVRGIYNGLVLSALPLFVSIGILVPLGILIHLGNPQGLAEQLKQFEAPAAAVVTANPQTSPSTNTNSATPLLPATTQPEAASSNAQPLTSAQGTTASAEQLKFVFYLVKYFFWFVVVLHFFPLWFFYQNIGPINNRWKIINSMQIPPSLYDDLKKLRAGDAPPAQLESKTNTIIENKPEIKESTQSKKPSARK